MPSSKVQAVRWLGDSFGQCVLLDQTLLPSQEKYLEVNDYRQVIKAIQALAVRGAPAIGVAGAYAVVLAFRESLKCTTSAEQVVFFSRALEEIASARPTAVNLRWAVDRMKRISGKISENEERLQVLFKEASSIHEEDLQSNLNMARLGAELLPFGKSVMTYCNTGDLATGGVGTAFGVLHAGYLQGKVSHVFACETRPVLQGLRLTAWELAKNQIPFSVICDNMAALTLRDANVGAVIVGADRVAANGDAANKVGTYGLAVLAKHHGVPFYIVAPTSTFDLNLVSGKDIPIEQRSPQEILDVLHQNRHPFSVSVNNPSFDVTPHELITAIVCEKGVIHSPSVQQVARLVNGTKG